MKVPANNLTAPDRPQSGEYYFATSGEYSTDVDNGIGRSIENGQAGKPKHKKLVHRPTLHNERVAAPDHVPCSPFLSETINLPEPEALLEMTSDIVTAMVSNNKLTADELPGLIGSVYASIAALGQAPTTEAQGSKPEAAVSIRKSLTDPEVIISMIDGKPYKMLTRHLRTQGYTPDSYRKTFGLNPDYPMVAAAYSTKRRALAKSFGLGRTKALAAPPEAVVGEPISEPAAATKAAAAKKPRRSRKAAPEQGAAF